MHLEVSNKHCPLCKRAVATGDHPEPTRLCEECRSLLYTILPKAGSNSFAADQSQVSGQTSLVNSGRLVAPVPFDEGLSDPHFDSQEHQTEFASFNPVTDFEEFQVAPGDETEYFDDFDTSDDQTYVPAGMLSDPTDETQSQPLESRAAMPQVFLMAEPPDSFQNKVATLEAKPTDETLKLNLLQAEEPAHLTSLPHSIQADKETETVSEMGTASEQETADPWDDPLPSWEYSRNEYPLYVGVSDRKPIRKLRSMLVPATVILFLVVAYLVFQSRAGAPQDQHPEVKSEQTKVEGALPVAPAQATDAAKPASDDAKKADSEEAAVEKASAPPSEAPANEGARAEWRHALQALASSSEDEANSFAAKLVRAGIPAYVVPADIARRGKWYRVRVGGFDTAQEAQRFIAEARLRAKAAGINLKDLNVVDYERP